MPLCILHTYVYVCTCEGKRQVSDHVNIGVTT